MTTENRISVVEPISPAIEKVKQILFRPFDIGRWFVIGFCAWLANFGRQCGGFNFPFDEVKKHKDQATDFIMNNLALVIAIGSVLLFLIIIISVVLLWLSSRGKFMLLDCVAQNKAEVKNPWNKFGSNGNSLLLFRLIAGIITFILFAIILAGAAILFFLCRQDWPHLNIGAIFGIIILCMISLPVFIAVAVMFKFTFDFVVPIMYLRNCGCVDGWRQFLSLLSENKARFTLYILFQIVLAMVIGTIVLMTMCLTCCIACCLLIIPFIGTVFLLPIFVFKQAYALMYLRQYGSNYDVFIPAAPAVNI